ncbi:oligosaccharyl transferase glycoprotein complex, beta subunit [Microbotryomycetes sp. JL201]|nr:oligosaccharyl transferase glycoprotein complex, beta subunit [Microbotryomycetes sp. JL201]
MLAVSGLLCLASVVSASRVLFVDSDSSASRYSQYTQSLRDAGHEVTVQTAQQAAATLRQDPLGFDNIVTFTTDIKSPPAELAPQSLVNLLRNGVNILTAASTDVSEAWRDFVREFEIDFDDRGNSLIDHFEYDRKLDVDGKHTTIVVPLTSSPSPVVSPQTKAGPPVLYRGIAHQIGRHPLLQNVLSAPVTSYSYDPLDTEALSEDAFVSGSSAGLVSVFQLKHNSARIAFAGSKDLFSDELFDAAVSSASGHIFAHSGNKAFVKDLTQWVFAETGRLTASPLRHSRVSDGTTGDLYRVKEEIDVAIDFSELRNGQWKPYVADDVQLELVMLDPHIRIDLVPSSSSTNSTTYTARFNVPDRHGVFTFKVDYRRPGTTWIERKEVVSIVPPRHDQYDRFIVGAAPFYVGAASVSVATFIFLFLFMASSW